MKTNIASLRFLTVIAFAFASPLLAGGYEDFLVKNYKLSNNVVIACPYKSSHHVTSRESVTYTVEATIVSVLKGRVEFGSPITFSFTVEGDAKPIELGKLRYLMYEDNKSPMNIEVGMMPLYSREIKNLFDSAMRDGEHKKNAKSQR
jgi:hypothetical protein